MPSGKNKPAAGGAGDNVFNTKLDLPIGTCVIFPAKAKMDLSLV
jgi:hypothetical protein